MEKEPEYHIGSLKAGSIYLSDIKGIDVELAEDKMLVDGVVEMTSEQYSLGEPRKIGDDNAKGTWSKGPRLTYEGE